jgi:hypothetical protein
VIKQRFTQLSALAAVVMALPVNAALLTRAALSTSGRARTKILSIFVESGPKRITIKKRATQRLAAVLATLLSGSAGAFSQPPVALAAGGSDALIRQQGEVRVENTVVLSNRAGLKWELVKTTMAWALGALSLHGKPVELAAQPLLLKSEDFRHYADEFNHNDEEVYQGTFQNAVAWDFLKDSVPLLDCPDADIQSIYYFRWWTYRKHIKQTPARFIVDEFLPNVGWAGKYNSISCAAGHHIYEGRWLRDPKYLDDYSRFWFHGGGEPRRYSFWVADSIWARYCVTGEKTLSLDLLPELIRITRHGRSQRQ